MSASALKIIKANVEARAKIVEELRAIDEAAEGRAYTPDEEAAITEKRSALEGIDNRVSHLVGAEIRSAEIVDAMGSLAGLMARENGDVVDVRSLGQRFAQSDEVRAWAESNGRGASPAVDVPMEFRAVTDLTTAGTAAAPQRLTRIGTTMADRRTYLIDLLPSIQIGTGTVEYVQDVSPAADMADAAVEVAEGAAKPQAGITLAPVSETAATIAAWVNITRQAAADTPQLQGYLDGRLRYSLKRRADGQAINGNGTTPNLRGLRNRSGILAYAPAGAEPRYRSIRHAIRLMEDAETVPEIIVLNPADAELFDLSNDTTAGLHAADTLTGVPARTAWGLQQVRSTAVPAGTALLIDPMSVAVFDRQQVTAYMTDSHGTNFTSNILTLLVEARLGLGLFDPKGVLALTFNGAA